MHACPEKQGNGPQKGAPQFGLPTVVVVGQSGSVTDVTDDVLVVVTVVLVVVGGVGSSAGHRCRHRPLRAYPEAGTQTSWVSGFPSSHPASFAHGAHGA